MKRNPDYGRKYGDRRRVIASDYDKQEPDVMEALEESLDEELNSTPRPKSKKRAKRIVDVPRKEEASE